MLGKNDCYFFVQTTKELKEWVSQWICSKTHNTCSRCTESHVVFFPQHCCLDRLACIPLYTLDTI